jgi:HK97 gp10 family phage protein
MRNQVTLSLKGADKVFKKLKEYPVAVQKAVDDSIKINIVDIHTQQVNTPIPVDTGNMKNLHTFYKEGDNWVIESRADYSAFVEFGTSKQAAQPWFFPPYYRNYNKIIKDAKNAIERVR